MSEKNKQKQRHNWTHAEIAELFALPFPELMWRAQQVHRANHDPNAIQLSNLLNIKTAACPEDCGFCAQSGHFKAGIAKEKLWAIDDVLAKAKQAKAQGATRFCMGCAWRHLPERELPILIQMIQGVKAMGLEACLTAGFITPAQAQALKEAGLDYYNHNLETSPEFYEKIVSTHRFQDRLDTVMTVQEAGLGVCCGGIVGMGESLDDRISLLKQLANLPAHPGSVTINKLIPLKGTPLENTEIVSAIDFVKVVAVARIILPTSRLRLSGGRREMSEELQVLCFLAGASSIHTGEKLLVTEIFGFEHDKAMLERLGMKEMQMQEAN